MKKHSFIYRAILFAVTLGITLTSCDKEDDPLDPLFSATDQPFGKTQEAWEIEWWQFLMSHDCNTFPTAGTESQSGDVYFLSGRIETYNFNITVRSDQAILSPVINYINDFPCPDTSFHPAPGQSTEDFLQEGAASFMTFAQDLRATLDGKELPLTHSITDLFYFTGNPDIANCLDPCVTGESQAAVSDGYWVFIRPLSKGPHTLTLEGKLAFNPPAVMNGTIHITVN
jgi:hypothetical protein